VRHDAPAQGIGGLSADPSPARLPAQARRPTARGLRRLPRTSRRDADHDRAGARLGEAARRRPATFETLIGLLAAAGLRLGEALSLDRQDVDLKSGALHVHAKRGKQREVPVHATTTKALGKYARLRDRHWPEPNTPAFFVSTRAQRLTASEVHYTFPRLIRQIGLQGRGHRATPRPHDFRHAFAVRTLLDWHQADAEVDRKLPLLSTYLGHRDPADTQWYLQAVPELLALVAKRLDGVLGEQS